MLTAIKDLPYSKYAVDFKGMFESVRASCRGRSIALDIIKGLSFLHRHRIMHLDIKSPNILLTQNWEARIADVGLGKTIAGEGSIATQGDFLRSSEEYVIPASRRIR